MLRVVFIKQIGNFLRNDYRSKLVHTDDLVEVDDEVVDPTNLRLLLSLCQVRARRGLHGGGELAQARASCFLFYKLVLLSSFPHLLLS